MNNEPMKLTNTLLICISELEMVADRLYKMESEEAEEQACAIDDATAYIEMVRKYCKERKL